MYSFATWDSNSSLKNYIKPELQHRHRVVGQGSPRDIHIILATVVAFACLLEVKGKSLLLKTAFTSSTGLRGIELNFSEKLSL